MLYFVDYDTFKMEEITFGSFPDGTLNAKIDIPIANRIGIYWNFENNEEMVKLYFIVSHIRASLKDQSIFLIMPYIPNARMDRVHDEQTELFTLKHFCNFINSLKFDCVCVTDPHSNVSTALLDRVLVAPVLPIFWNRIYTDYGVCPDIIFFPDEGATKRYSSDVLTIFPEAKVCFGIKKRDWATGKIEGLDVYRDEQIDFTDKTVLIIDDICSKGGTFYHAATKLKKMDVGDIYLAVTHCENTVADGDIFCHPELIKHIYTTDSLITISNPERITVISIKDA